MTGKVRAFLEGVGSLMNLFPARNSSRSFN